MKKASTIWEVETSGSDTANSGSFDSADVGPWWTPTAEQMHMLCPGVPLEEWRELLTPVPDGGVAGTYTIVSVTGGKEEIDGSNRV